LPEGLERFFRLAERGDASIVAPDLLLAEAAQVLHKKRRQGLLTGDQARALLEAILLLPIETMSHRLFVQRASELAENGGLTVYDSLFLAVAETYDAVLFTADALLKKKGRELGVDTTID
jgi:predicted nucleic acid-binding protein